AGLQLWGRQLEEPKMFIKEHLSKYCFVPCYAIFGESVRAPVACFWHTINSRRVLPFTPGWIEMVWP
ncbi:MAG: hypothetical protein RR332_01940, partial [Clostridiales bacterium]